MIKEITITGLEGREDYILPLGGLDVHITLGAAGDMHRKKVDLIPDRREYLKRRGIPFDRFFYTDQQHTRKVVRVTNQSTVEEFRHLGVDGMITREKGLFLSVTMADCLPVLVYDKRKGPFGLFHSGWKGTGIVMEGIRQMEEHYGCAREDLGVWIGPGIGGCCYAVDRERADFFSREWGKDVVKTEKEVYYLDLRKANVNLLVRNKIEDITVVTNCTVCTPEFHSFRRQGPEAFKLMMAYAGYWPFQESDR